MSAFIFSHDEMQKIGEALFTFAYYRDNPYFWDTWTILGADFDGTDSRYTATSEQIKARVAKKLDEFYQMNVEAVNQRYNERIKVKLPTFSFTTFDYGDDEIFMEILDSLRSFRYQCCEGDVPETDLYKELDWYIGKICEAHLTRL